MNKRTKVEKTASSEQDLFERTMAGVRPLKKKTSHKKVNPPKSASYKSKAKFIKKTEFNVLEKPTLPRKDLIKLDPLSAEKVSGVDKRTVDRMRRGKLPIDARLDLHGEYQTTAQAQLESFILNYPFFLHLVEHLLLDLQVAQWQEVQKAPQLNELNEPNK